ncbi:DUF5979 domain-containing protein [Salinibacterium sp. M195]|uniref:DUF5979 domain-containing protein n=1 Tax=Salinibacterium sp. M195 TaxID=2583374 RepID=UPI001C63315A|nr:DUF5979 domain-containing protein [Salinibacterium sp. M195]QYH34795.1 hypothetical protein FFT87_01875 [Salinibacterium sp. M195]
MTLPLPSSRRRSPRLTWSGLTRSLAALAITVLVAGSGLATAMPAQADELGSGVLSLSKTASATGAELPGATFVYTLGFGCSSTTTGCVDAVLSDEIPAPLEIVGSPLVAGVGSSTVTVTGNRVEVAFEDAVANTDPPSTGLADSTTGTVQITVKVPDDLGMSWDGTAVTNDGNLVAVNALPRTAQATVPLRVPTVIAASLSKNWTPAAAEYGPGNLSNVTLTVANSSNISASELTISEPASPASAASTFNFYDLNALGAVTFPEGADRIQVDALVGGVWMTGNAQTAATLPTGALPAAVEGLRFTFTATTGATIDPRGTSGTVQLSLAQRLVNRATPTEELAAGGSRVNVAGAAIVTPDGGADAPDATATQVVAPLTASVAVTKSFSPEEIPAGESTVATIAARNTSTGALTSLSISEPSTAGSFFSDSIIFDGFDATATEWPSGATAGTVTWVVNTGTAPAPSAFTQASGLPAAPGLTAGQFITGFVLNYTGAIDVGATARAGVQIETTAAAAINTGSASIYSNAVDVVGTNAAGTGTATTSADLAVWTPAIEVELSKSIRPSAVYAGGNSIVELTATTPVGTSTVRPDEITITEPGAPGVLPASEYWNAFTPVAIGATAVPQGSILTIEYFDGSGWQSMAGSSGVIDATTSAQMFSGNLDAMLPSGVVPDDVEGLRFSFTDADGFARAMTVKPTIVFEARSELRDGTGTTNVGEPIDSATWTDYENCGAVTANGTLNATSLSDDAAACATATIIPTEGGPGTGPAPLIVDKAMDDATILAQSHDATGSTLTWGVQSAGYDTVTVSDTPNPAAATVANTMFQAFDLTRIDAISPAQDPLIRWDAVHRVELFSATSNAWVDVTGAACSPATNCVGNFPGYTLSAAERADTIGVRLTFVERADRAAIIAASADPLAPPAGSGVANLPRGAYAGASTAGRTIHLDWELRNVVRDDSATTDQWVTALETFNQPDAGVVRNTVGVVATPAVGSPQAASDSADITIVQTPPTVEATKSVTPTTVTIPRPGVAQADYPTATYTTTVQNTSPTNVWQLRLTDPSLCLDAATCAFDVTDVPFVGASYDPSHNPFERLNLTGIDISLSGASGITATEVQLWLRDAAGTLSVSSSYTQAQAEALTASQLQDVVGVTALFTGESTDGGTIAAGARATVTLETQLRQTLRDAETPITAISVPNSVLVGVHDNVLYPSIYNQDITTSPLAIDDGFIAVVAGKSIAPNSAVIAAPSTPVLVDLRARSTGTVAPKILTVQDDAATFWNAFTAVAAHIPTMPAGADRVEIEALVGTTWSGDGATTQALAALPASVDPADIIGVRATFARADGAEFSGTNDVVNLQIETQLRTQLRDGSGAVTTSESSAIMPGETIAGQISNAVGVTATHDALVDNDVADATFTLNAGTARMAIEKTSIGQTAAGKEIPFTLRLRNTGTGYLVNPVVTDVLPADSSLTFVPTDNPVYSTTSGGTLTTDAAQVVRSFDAATGEISFTWPTGARLAPGETYSITLRLEVKPGLAAASVADNGMTVTNDRQLEACAPLNSSNGRAVTLADNTCSTSNVVTVLALGSFSAQKGVKSTAGTASNSVNPSVNCTPDAGGYYRYPCAANSTIGGTDEWKLQLINGGTIGAASLELIDIFPHVGDTGVVDPSPRGSAFAPEFNGDVSFTSTTPGVGFDWYYTTDANVCTADLFPATADCATGDWMPSSSLAAGSGATVTGIKAVFDFSALADGALPPASVLTVNYTTTNMPSSSNSAGRVPLSVPFEDVHAWNSFGYYTTYVSGPNPPSPEEPIKAGIGLFAGSITINKVMEGSEAGRAPQTITAGVECSVFGAPVDMGSVGALTLDAATGYTARIDGIPQGADCIVTEDGMLGWFGEQERNGPQTVTVAHAATAADEVPAAHSATLVNTYTPALLAFTGAQGISALLTVGLVGVLAGAVLLVVRRRRTAR